MICEIILQSLMQPIKCVSNPQLGNSLQDRLIADMKAMGPHWMLSIHPNRKLLISQNIRE
ncbi:hypothetical protein TSMEX_005411 [Taenia solium]|eukprot:TsM_000119700 transcript=TsM_000119700 gene=TsM_000119700